MERELTMENTEYEIDLREIFHMLQKRWVLITGITVSALIISATVSFFVLTPQYETGTTLMVNYKTTDSSLMNYTDLQMSQKLVATYSEIVKSERIADIVINQLDLEMTANQLNKKISVSQVGTTEILKITVKDEDPQLAALMANTISQVFQQEINDMMDVENVSTIDIAKVPEDPTSPNKKMNIAIAGVLGLMLGVGLVFVLEFLDRTYKTPTDVERHLGLPLIGAIPDMMLEQGK